MERSSIRASRELASTKYPRTCLKSSIGIKPATYLPAMPLAVLFWVLMVISLIFGWWVEYVPGQPFPVRRVGYSFLYFVLLAILGWQVFGPAVR